MSAALKAAGIADDKVELKKPEAITGSGNNAEARRVEVALRPEDHNMPVGPWIDPEEFSSGYVARGNHLLPKRGDKPEWQHTHDYWSEKDALPAIDLTDPAFVYR